MRSDRRDVLFYDITIKSSSQYAAPATMRTTLEALHAIARTDQARHSIQDNTELLVLRDVALDPARNVAVIFAAHTNPAAPNPAFGNVNTGVPRIVPKEDGEAREHGCHIAISLSETAPGSCTYLAVLERAQGLGRALLMRLLNACISGIYRRQPATWASPDLTGKLGRDGQPKLVNNRPVLECRGHPGEGLIDSINAGRLLGVSLVNTTVQPNFLGKPYLSEKEKELKLKVDRGNLVADLYDDLTRALAGRAADYDKARIRFEDEGGSQYTVVVDLQTLDVLDDRFVKKVQIVGIDPPVHDSSETIVPHFAERLLQVLAEARE